MKRYKMKSGPFKDQEVWITKAFEGIPFSNLPKLRFGLRDKAETEFWCEESDLEEIPEEGFWYEFYEAYDKNGIASREGNRDWMKENYPEVSLKELTELWQKTTNHETVFDILEKLNVVILRRSPKVKGEIKNGSEVRIKEDAEKYFSDEAKEKLTFQNEMKSKYGLKGIVSELDTLTRKHGFPCCRVRFWIWPLEALELVEE